MAWNRLPIALVELTLDAYLEGHGWPVIIGEWDESVQDYVWSTCCPDDCPGCEDDDAQHQ